ncbi:hypothetical protein FLONG3_6389, partial [Fusarium longipes]
LQILSLLIAPPIVGQLYKSLPSSCSYHQEVARRVMAFYSGWMRNMASCSGWKRTAVYLTGLVATLTAFLIVVLFVSLFALERYEEPRIPGIKTTDSLGQSILYRGNCDNTSSANLWIHLAINVIGTGVLASSNFFMQSLVAPTRKEVDAAHKAGKWLEIGVQSLKNIPFLGWRKILFWSLFSLSSVPLHLVFNGCVLESKGTNGFTVLLGAESLVRGNWQGQPPISRAHDMDSVDVWERGQYLSSVRHINKSISTNDSHGSWHKITFQECMKRYNDPERSLTHWRHLIMVMYDYDDEWRNSTDGWRLSQVYRNSTNKTHTNKTNILWEVGGFTRTGVATNGHPYYDTPSGAIASPYSIVNRNPGSGQLLWAANTWDMADTSNFFDPTSGLIVMDRKVFMPEYRVMQVDYCWSEKFEAPCRLSIANSLLLIVCIMCTFKCTLCFLVLRLRVWGNDNPLMTPGDAIASFIAKPSEETKDMCTLSLEDLKGLPSSKKLGFSDTAQGYKLLQGPRQWHTTYERKFGRAVPRTIWIVSSILIGTSLVVAAWISEARFGHSPVNESVDNEYLNELSLLPLTMVANSPQLILSICYLAYNGLFTRMLAEFEWSKYSIEFRALRVTEPKGNQNSTYRLQLPYSIYVSNYEAYSPETPPELTVTIGLQFSSKAILISFVMSVCVAVVPILLANVKLPGIMVISAGNSAVISAACHYPSRKLNSLSRTTSRFSHHGSEYDSMSARLIGEELVDELEAVSRKKVKWGRLSMGTSDGSKVGHLGFGTEDQDVDKPVDGEYYSGL